MKPVSITEARANLASVLSSATDDLDEVVITRAGHEPAVVVALSEYEALKETAYLLGTRANARRLEQSIEEHRGGMATPQELIDPDEDSGPASTRSEEERLEVLGLAESESPSNITVGRRMGDLRPENVRPVVSEAKLYRDVRLVDTDFLAEGIYTAIPTHDIERARKIFREFYESSESMSDAFSQAITDFNKALESLQSVLRGSAK
ncbi:type II toxin-antitoxin system Phd/YefM family antitoxin [Nocardia sp. NPDC057227]|uniref:type II toxin-antitoxin system Phd/YefM family antitoxin n=1 Tax=Nocardia sp. NPDC057227 TaxID=3346056 RepID=UPI0036269F28